ncbi:MULTISPECIES: VOC family protein [Parabacteroides]|uniref:VOC family protein n=2 Tax=Parabacteroides leei TaxID=2939491 RepID=UPI00189ABD87|nr:VOC family protein [Parabacteroides goldsteinii]
MKFKDLSITFHTDKMKECIDFYCTHFQATITFDDGEWYVVIRLQSDNNTQPLFLSFQGPNNIYEREDFTGGVSLNLKTENVEECYRQIKRAGIPFVEEITDHEWGDRAFSIKDPIGNLLYIYSDRPIADKYRDAVKD